MCWCLHFSPLTGSICCSTIETVLDGLGVRDPGGFLHIWQRLAFLTGESHPMGGWLCCGPLLLSAWASGSVLICLAVTSIFTCFSISITPLQQLHPCCSHSMTLAEPATTIDLSLPPQHTHTDTRGHGLGRERSKKAPLKTATDKKGLLHESVTPLN